MKYDELSEFTRELISIESLSGEERNIGVFLKKRMHKFGFSETYIDKFGTVVGIIRGALSGPTILMDGHIDHVVVNNPELWSMDPFKGGIKEGRMYGRGTSDMKGALAAMILAAKHFAENKKNLKGNIIVTGTAWEELFEGYTLGYAIEELKTKGYAPDLVIIGEASELDLKIGQRGRAEVVVTSLGKSCHSSNPQFGINAVYNAIDIIKAIADAPRKEDAFIGKAIFELTDIISKPYPGYSVVPEECTISYDRRLLPGERKEDVIAEVEKTLEPLKAKNDKLKYMINIVKGELSDDKGRTYETDKFAPGWVFPQDAPFIKKALAGLEGIGLKPRITRYSFCTNGSMSAGIMNIPTIGFGPSAESQAHVVDEYIEIDQLEKAYEGYMAIIKEEIKE